LILMMRRRIEALRAKAGVSNHEVPAVASSFETLACGEFLRMRRKLPSHQR